VSDEPSEINEERGNALDDARLKSIIGLVKKQLPKWRDGAIVKLPCGHWRPHLVGPDRRSVLHVHLATRIRPYLATRLKEASKSRRPVHVVLELESLYDEETVRLLSACDAQIHVLDGENISVAQHLLTALSDQGVPVSPTVRSFLGDGAWRRRRDGTSQERGRRFEGLLAFLLSQVADFRVKERNLRGETDELDIVVQIDNHSPRCWHKSGAPFILVEAKNWKERVGQEQVSVFITKVQTKRGAARCGFMFGASGFTSDANTQILKFATQDLVIVLVGPEELANWIAREKSDDYLEDLVRLAMLR